MTEVVTFPVAVLGPLEVHGADGPVPVGGEKIRALLGLLALEHHRTTSVTDLIDAIWEEAPPTTAPNAIQVYVAAIRKCLRTAGLDQSLQTVPRGYRLELPEGALDRDAFFAARTRASEQLARGRRDLAAEEFRSALALWRGPALSDLDTVSSVRARAAQLNDVEQRTFEAFAANELALGRAVQLVPRLTRRGIQNPVREPLWALIALAQYQSGDQAAALTSIRTVKAALRDQVGVAPGPRLRALETAILRQDPALLVVDAPQVTTPDGERPERTLTVPNEPGRTTGARLVLEDGRHVNLHGAPVTIGRADGCDVVLSDSSVSGLHVRIRPGRHGHIIEDLGSKNGTVINGRPISRRQLEEDDEILLGGSRMHYRMAAAAD